MPGPQVVVLVAPPVHLLLSGPVHSFLVPVHVLTVPTPSQVFVAVPSHVFPLSLEQPLFDLSVHSFAPVPPLAVWQLLSTTPEHPLVEASAQLLLFAPTHVLEPVPPLPLHTFAVPLLHWL